MGFIPVSCCMFTFYVGNYYEKFRMAKHRPRPTYVLVMSEIGKNCLSSG
jgi:hypothetical protein